MLHLFSRVPTLSFDSFLFILVAMRFIRMRMAGGMGDTPLLVVFVRDGTWAFVLIFGELRMMPSFTNPLTPQPAAIAASLSTALLTVYDIAIPMGGVAVK